MGAFCRGWLGKAFLSRDLRKATAQSLQVSGFDHSRQNEEQDTSSPKRVRI